jgi:GNAT superfamily N-acetyltransferase
MPLRLRRAGPADLPALAELIQAAYRDPHGAGWTTESHLVRGRRTTAEELGTILAEPNSVILVVEDDTGPVGCCHVRQEDAGTAYFGMFAVRPARQGGGTGTSLLRSAEEQARSWGCARLRMQVIESRQELIAWYLRQGYARSDQRIPFPTDKPDDQPLVPDLHFVVLTKPLP